MGPALFDATSSATQLDAPVVRELSVVLKEEKIPLNDAERDQLVGEITDQVLGYGPIERYLDDPTVSEVMVNGLDGVYVERDGKLEHTDASVPLRRPPPPGDRPHRRAARPPDRRVVADGRRPPPRRFARQRDHPAARDRRPGAHHPQVLRSGVRPLDDLVRARAPSPARSATFLAACVTGRMNILISGGTGTRQDHAAQRAVVDDPRQRAHRHHRGRRRAAAPAASRGAAREPARQHRGEGRGTDA